MSLLAYLAQYRFSHMGELIRNSAKGPLGCTDSLKGKRVVLTGATAGIGLETARLFAEKGADLILINRNPVKAENLAIELEERYGCSVKNIIADFSTFRDIRRCADELLSLEEPIDILIHNAGVFNTRMQITEDNIEMVFQVNHLAPFYLNYRLRDRLRMENRARIIFVNSEGHRFALGGVHLNDLKWKRHIYTGLKSYGAAKTAQLLTMRKLNDFYRGSGVTVNAMHPGNVRSDMGNNNGKLYLWMKKKLILSSAEEPQISAAALYYLSAAEEMKDQSGKFYNLTTEERPAPHALDEKQVEPVWQKSLELCGLKDGSSAEPERQLSHLQEQFEN